MENNNFIKTYHAPAGNTPYKHTTTVRHNGTVIAFAMDSERRVYYSVLDLSDQKKGPFDVNYWQENPATLSFPDEIVTVGQGLIDPVALPLVKKGTREEAPTGTRLKENEKNLFLSTTARLTADAPIQAISDGKYVYVFRQSIAADHPDAVFLRNAKGEEVTDIEGNRIPLVNDTLLVDRFILSGVALLPKRELRFQRSRNKFRPLNRKDGLDTKDLEKKPFFEPTQKLDFIRHLTLGRFSVLLVPTQIAGIKRWQIFSYNAGFDALSRRERVDSFNIEYADDTIFNTRGRVVFTCPDHTNLRLLKGGACPEPALADPTKNCPYELIPFASRSGFAESALRFDGVDDYVGVQIPQLSVTEPVEVTIEVWLKPAQFTQAQNVLSLGANQEENITLDADGQLSFQYGPRTNGVPARTFSSNVNLPSDAWSHIALVRSQSERKLRWFVNGVLKNEATLDIVSAATNLNEMRIGHGYAGYFTGVIDEVRLWNRPRFQEELRESMSHRLIGYEIGLLGYWHFDEASGVRAFDQTEHSNDGQIFGGVEWVTSDAPVGDHPGIRRSSFKFADRTIQSGFTSLLYFEQEKALSGYEGQSKPLKKAGRVMLACATQSASLPTPQDEIDELERRFQNVSSQISSVEENIKTLQEEKAQLEEAIQHAQATVFRHIYYIGDSLSFSVGDHGPAALGTLNKNISSVKVPLALKVTFYSAENFTGDDLLVSGDARDASQVDAVGEVNDFRAFAEANSPTTTWNDYPASVRVEEAPLHRQAREQIGEYLPTQTALLEQLKLELGQLSNQIKATRRHIAVLDFSLSKDGQLTQIPDNLNVPLIENPNPSTTTVYEILDQINQLEQLSAKLTNEKAALQAQEVELRQQPFVDAAMHHVDPDSDEAYQLFFKDQRVLVPGTSDDNVEETIEQLDVVKFFKEQFADKSIHAAISYKFGDAHPAYFFENENVHIFGLPEKEPEETEESKTEKKDNKAKKDDGEEEENPVFGSLEWAKRWANGSVGTGSACVKLGQKYYFFKQQSYNVYHADTDVYDEPVLISEGDFPSLWPDGVDAAIEISDTSVCFLKGLSCKQYELSDGTITLAAETTLDSLFPGLLERFGFPALEENLRKQQEADAQLAAIPQQIAGLNAALEEARAAELRRIDVRVPMPLLHTDEAGLTLVGGLLGFSWTKDTPLLFDSANGQLGLYFRGLADQFFVAYYDTMKSVVGFQLPTDESGEVILLPRQSGSWEGSLVEVSDGAAPDLCTVFIKNDEQEMQELWRDVPRHAEDFADVLNGVAVAKPLGALARELSGTVTHLEITGSIPDVLTPGRMLQVAGKPVKVVEVIKHVALQFGGVDDYVELPDVVTSDQGTIEMWIKFPAELDDQAIFDASNEPSPERYFLIEILSDKLRFALEDKTGTNFNLAGERTAKLELGETWHHLAAVWKYRGTPATQLYLDGKLVKQDGKTTSGRPVFRTPFIGKSRGEYKSNDNFHGQVGEIVVWNERRSKEQIRDDMTRSIFDSNFAALVGRWLFQDQNGMPVAVSYAPNQQSATIHGNPPIAAFATGTTIIKIETAEFPQPVPIGEPVYISYDYENNPERNFPSSEKRSKLLAADASRAKGTGAEPVEAKVLNVGITGKGVHSPNTEWVADAPGTALSFDGEDGFVGLADSNKLPLLNPENDLSLEAWVHPDEVENVSRVVYHKSDDRTYTLALEKAAIKSAMLFDGAQDYIDCGRGLNPGNQPWTVELWFRCDRATGQNILYNKENLYEAAVNDGYFQFAFQPDWVWFGEKSFPVAEGEWYHAAVVYDGIQQYLYRNGLLVFSRNKGNTGDIGSNASKLLLGARGDSSPYNFFKGAIDEVRVWNVARSGADLRANMNLRFSGAETGLQSYWHFEGRIARDYTNHGNDGIINGNPAVADSPIPAYAVVAGAGAKIDNQFTETFVKSNDAIPCNQWNHLAAVYNESFALRFDGRTSSVNCGNNASLNIRGDLTIEAFLRVDDLSQPRSIVTKGQQNVPYSFYINTRGNLVFYFDDVDGNRRTFISSDNLRLTPGTFYRVAATRQHRSETHERTMTQVIDGKSIEVKVPEVEEWDDINFYIGRLVDASYVVQQTGNQRYDDAGADGNDQELVIAGALAGRNFPFAGVISEVRLWSVARDNTQVGGEIHGVENGLISWWRFEENAGYVAEDSVGTNHGTLNNTKWLKNPDKLGSTFTLFLNGSLMESRQVNSDNYARGINQFTLGALAGSTGSPAGAVPEPVEGLRGTLEELRVWRIARTQEQIQDNLFRRLLGEKENLIAYYTFDKIREAILKDQSLRGNHLSTLNNVTFILSTAPISSDTYQIRSALAEVKTVFNDVLHSQPGVQEYGDMQFDAEGNLIGVLKRTYSFIKDGEWHLVTGYKVGNLITEWVGQVQFNPELKGFIEGAPPVPSENLTAGALDPSESNHSDAAALEVVEAESVTFTYSATREAGLNAGFGLSASAGVDTTTLLITAPLGIGTAQEIADVNVLVGVEANFEAASSWTSENSVGAGRNLTKSTKVSLNGNWEAPDNRLNEAMTRRFQPANTGFALVQSETADVFALRLSHNLALVSFQFRPNPDIPKDWNIIPFPINPRYTKQGTLDGAVGYDARGKVLDPDYPNARDYGQHSYFKPKEAYSLKNQIVREEQELRTYFESLGTNLGGATDLAISAGLGLIKGASGGAGSAIEGLIGALASHTGVPEKLAKQNLVNTYVWTAEGGFFSESTEAMSMKQETTAGSFSFSGSVGLSIGVDFSVVGVDVSLGFNAMLGGNLNLTKTKTKESQNSFSLNVEIGVPGDLKQYDDNLDPVYDDDGNPIIVPGKVDAYRFMTFYLEPNLDHFDEFFNNVVDPLWLQGAHPNALALKQAQQSDKKPPCWRVMHRVTFVSRILPEIAGATVPPFERNMKAANIDSNWELIQKLDPFVRNKTATFLEFSDAIRAAIETHLPELKSNVEEIIRYLSGYYQVFEEEG